MTGAGAPAGASLVHPGGTLFRVWAPAAESIELAIENKSGAARRALRTASDDGWFELVDEQAGPGTLYRFFVDGRGPFPDPASRFQPLGVHGPSQVIDPGAFGWTDDQWRGVPLERLVLYELHVGTFTPDGTFRSAIDRLPALAELGVTALEILPVADFPGQRNWGYDGVSPYAPARCYGHPDDFRALVDAAHHLGLAVHLDVVYNHLGPDGAYQSCFTPHYYSVAHTTPWGAAINFDGPHSAGVRRYVIDNAVAWIRDFHLDGLRLDATHAIVDESSRSIMTDLAGAIRKEAAVAGRPVPVIAEDARNLAHIVQPESAGGWGLDAVWSDDFHHQVRRRVAGDSDGYFQDFTGSAADIAATARRGWFYHGQFAGYFGRPRGTEPEGTPSQRFVFFIQNHDQVGNRACGERLHHQVPPAAFRAVSTLLLILPETPLLFMGQEWAASTPWLFFTDHNPELGEAVRKGRREEFARFAAFRDPAARERIPDPQDTKTFDASRLDWSERERPPHREVLALYRRLLVLRRTEPALAQGETSEFAVEAWSDDVILVRRKFGGQTLLAVIRLEHSGPVDLAGHPLALAGKSPAWEVVLNTSAPEFGGSGGITVSADNPAMSFAEPGAVILVARGHVP